MDYDIDSILSLEDGDIKVELQDLRELYVAMKEDENKDFIDIFMKKYVQLPAVRREEQQAYSHYELAKKIAPPDKEDAKQFVNKLRKEYSEIRNDRIGLQMEIKEYESKHYRFDRLLKAEEEKSKQNNKPRLMGVSR